MAAAVSKPKLAELRLADREMLPYVSTQPVHIGVGKVMLEKLVWESGQQPP